MLNNYPSCYLSPKCESRFVPGKGYGAFALEPIAAGELIAAWGGTVIPGEALTDLSDERRMLSVQIEENLFLAPDRLGPGDRINHSCSPNAGISGSSNVVAMRDIAPGEEITYDYAMSDGSPYDEFDCACGSPACRKRVTGDDWRRPELWEKYDGYFSMYLRRRIERLKQEAGMYTTIK